MSETSDRTSCISHKALVHYFVMYEDFLEVAKVSEHQYKLAAFWRVLETKTNDRITYNEGAREKGQPVLDLWIEIPYSEFVNRSLGVYKASSFQVAAAESERLGFSKSRVGKRPRNPLDPNSPKDEYKEYLLLTGTLQKTINTGEYPTPIEINSPLLKSISARKEAKKQKKAIENNRDGVEINSPPVEINTSAIEINRNNNITESSSISKIKDTSDAVAFAPHHDTPASLSQDLSPDVSTQQANAVENPGQLADSSTVSQARDNGVREALDPLSTSEHVNTSPLTPEPLAQLSPTTQSEVVQASNGQSPIAAVATRNLDEEHATLSRSGEDTPPGSGASEQNSVQPEQPKRGGGRKKKQAVDLDHVEVLPPPAKPDESAPWNVRKVLAWGDFFRGYALPFSNNGNSHYVQNENAAVSIIQRGITEKNYVSVFRFMLGKKIMSDGTLANDPTFRDEWWPDKKSADVRYVEKHYTDMGVKINGRGKNGAAKGVSVQQQLQDKVPDFEVKSQADLIMMMPDERKAYAKRLNEHLTAQREREQSQQQQVSA